MVKENCFKFEARHQFRLNHTNKTYYTHIYLFIYFFARQLAKLYASFEHLSVIPTKQSAISTKTKSEERQNEREID